MPSSIYEGYFVSTIEARKEISFAGLMRRAKQVAAPSTKKKGRGRKGRSLPSDGRGHGTTTASQTLEVGHVSDLTANSRELASEQRNHCSMMETILTAGRPGKEGLHLTVDQLRLLRRYVAEVAEFAQQVVEMQGLIEARVAALLCRGSADEQASASP